VLAALALKTKKLHGAKFRGVAECRSILLDFDGLANLATPGVGPRNVRAILSPGRARSGPIRVVITTAMTGTGRAGGAILSLDGGCYGAFFL